MSEKVIRVGVDVSEGHCFTPRAATGHSPDTYANGIAIVREGDLYPSHCCGSECHVGFAESNSRGVYVNGKLIHRDTDPIDCGDVADNGSPDVYAG